MMNKYILGTAKKDLNKFDIVTFDDIEPIESIKSNDVHIFCRPCHFEIAKQLIQAGLGVITTQSITDKLDGELAKDMPTNAEPPKEWFEALKFNTALKENSDSESVGFGMASCKAEGGLVHYGTNKDFRLVTEKQFLDAIVNRSNVTIEKVGRRKKHYLYDDGLFAIKHKSKFYLLASVYSAILKGEE